MPLLESKLAWAIPVNVEALGANLEAYINLLPTLQTLRLCHRFGRDARITRLPAELLLNVEDVLIQEERRSMRKVWHKEYTCCSGNCKVKDHYSEAELDELREEAKREGWEFNVDDMDGDESFFSRHLDNKSAWRNRMGNDVPNGFFDKQNVTFRKHFGLEIWTANARQTASSDFDDYVSDDLTLAYLHVPPAASALRPFDKSQMELENDLYGLPEGLALDLSALPALPAQAKGQFKRAMALLNVKPYTQVKCVVSADKDESTPWIADSDQDQEEGTENGGSWPRLQMLIRTAL